MKTSRSFMDEAARLALKGMKRGHGGPFGAVIVKGDKIVGKGWNKTFRNTDPTAHAEIQAIRDAARRLGTLELAGCVIYTSGEPCTMCMAAIYWSMLDGVYFANTKEQSAQAGFDDSKIYKELQLSWKARAVNMVHAPNAIAAETFKQWELIKQAHQ